MAEVKNNNENKTKKATFCQWVGSPSFYIYFNFLLGAWGDRMWLFSVGLYLVALSKGHLRLAGIFGLATGLAVLLFGGVIGNWVDRNGRLKVIRISLFIQNFSVMLSAITVCFNLYFEDEVNQYWNGGLKILCQGLIIFFGITAELSSMAYKVAIEKDWIVVVADGKKSTLANLNAVLRALDLGCQVLSPTVAGIIMNYASLFYSAVVLAAWNLVSVFVEYAILTKVYYSIPALAAPKQKRLFGEDDKKSDEEIPCLNDLLESNIVTDDSIPSNKTALLDDKIEKSYLHNGISNTTKQIENGDTEKLETCDKVNQNNTTKKSFLSVPKEMLITMVESWGVYVKQKVVFAGLALSCLFMTVLGFDSITFGFLYTNGVDPSLTGISTGLAGLTGIFGTVLFTRLRKSIGLERTGLVGFSIQVLCHSLCLASVFAPGSPFQPFYKHGEQCHNNHELHTNISLQINNTFHHVGKRDLQKSTIIFHNSFQAEDGNMAVFGDLPFGKPDFSGTLYPIQELEYNHMISRRDLHNLSVSSINTSLDVSIIMDYKLELSDSNINNNETACQTEWKAEGVSIAMIFLLVGIVTSRTGLWMSDLAITQIVQEFIPENQRGVVGGVQNSINKFLEFIKFALVILLPHVQTFGFLVMFSYTFISMAFILFSVHTCRAKGYACCNKIFNQKPETQNKMNVINKIDVESSAKV